MFCRSILLLLVVSSLNLFSVSAEPPAEKEKLTIEFRRAETSPAEGLKEAKVRGSEQKVYLSPKAEVTLIDIEKVVATKDEFSGSSALSITLTKQGGEKMRKVTETQIGKPLAIVVNGDVITAPMIRDVLSTRLVISGLKADEAEELVKLFEKR